MMGCKQTLRLNDSCDKIYEAGKVAVCERVEKMLSSLNIEL